MTSLFCRLAALFGFLGVALGAFGAHKLEPLLEAKGTLAIWETAVLYHLLHAVAALWAAEKNPLANKLWLTGMFLFSGSLYAYALSEWKPLVFVTPIGGLVLLAGWLVVVTKGSRP